MSSGYHEPYDHLSEQARDVHRALASLIEELEAVDWYHQRVDVTNDDALKQILIHNRDEEVEHAAMTLEWLRRKLPKFDEELRTYLFTEAPIHQVEALEEGEQDEKSSQPSQSNLSIGSLKKGDQ